MLQPAALDESSSYGGLLVGIAADVGGAVGRMGQPQYWEFRDMKNLMKRLFVEEQGQDVIEYALLAAGISVMVIPVAPQIGDALVIVYNDILGDVNSI